MREEKATHIHLMDHALLLQGHISKIKVRIYIYPRYVKPPNQFLNLSEITGYFRKAFEKKPTKISS